MRSLWESFLPLCVLMKGGGGGGGGGGRGHRVPSREEHPVAGRFPRSAGLRVEEAELVLQRRLRRG